MKHRFSFDGRMGRGGRSIVEALVAAGYHAYFVGGCVRDSLLSRNVKDIDIATSARPEQVLALFAEAIPTGLQHGTVTIPRDGFHYEVTTFRTESEYSDGRHPDAVRFIDDIEGDLARRDFTINAMAAEPVTGELIDPYGGFRDLQAGLLRAVGDAAERFREDGLRMLRCVRFAAEYGLTVEPATWHETCQGAPGLQLIAMERVYAELKRMIGGAAPYRAIALLAESGLLRWTKERLRLPRSLGLRGGGEEEPLSRLGSVPEPISRWIFWFALMELPPEEASLCCKALRTSGSFESGLVRALGFHRALRHAPPPSTRSAWITAALQYGADAAERWHRGAEPFAPVPDLQWMQPFAASGSRWLDEMSVKHRKDLAVSGEDLLKLSGRKRGPWVSHLIDRLLRETALGELANDREAQLARAKTLLELDKPGREGGQ